MAAGLDSIYKQRILKVLVYIQRRLNEGLTLEELAAVAHFSPYHFHHIFKAMVGESVMQHIRRVRLEWAAQRLTLSNQPVTTIALEAGYETHEGFTRAFKKMFGRPPSTLRTKARKVIYAEVPSSVHYHPEGKLEDFEPVHSGQLCAEIRIETLEPVTVAFVRHVGPYEECGAAWEELVAWAAARRLLDPQTLCAGLAYDDPEVTPPDKLRYDACIAVKAQIRTEGDIGIQQIQGGQYAMLTHRGSFSTLGESIEKLYRWLPTSGRELRPDPLLLLYRNIMDRPAPQDMLVDLCLPLELSA